MHNLEHGYTLLWYDDTVAKDATQLAVVKGIAGKFESSTENGRDKFIAVPWTGKDGKGFPQGTHVALTHWSMGGTHGHRDQQAASGSTARSRAARWCRASCGATPTPTPRSRSPCDRGSAATVASSSRRPAGTRASSATATPVSDARSPTTARTPTALPVTTAPASTTAPGISTLPDTVAPGPTRTPAETAEPPPTRAVGSTSAVSSTQHSAGCGPAGLGATPRTRSREAATRAAGVPTSRQ